MRQRPGTSKILYLLLVVLLGAALAVGYFLYFRPEPPETAEVTVPTASRTAQNTKPKTSIRGKITAEKPPEPPPDPAEILAEFESPFVPTPPRELITPDLPDNMTAKVSPPAEPVKTEPETTEAAKPEISPQPEPAKPEPVKPEASETEASSSPVPTEPETPKAEAAPLPEPPKSETSKPEAPKVEPSPAPSLAEAPKPSKGGKWVANVLSTRDGDVARHILDQLMKQPYRVYAYKTVVKGKEYYRIRVGFFNTQSEAEKVGLALSAKYRLPKPWIVRPGPQELKKYQD